VSKIYSVEMSQGAACDAIKEKMPGVSDSDISRVLNALEYITIDSGNDLTIEYTTSSLHITRK
jgi:hypothetical protein